MWGQARKDCAVSSSPPGRSSTQRRAGREGQERKGRAGEGSGAAWSFWCCAFKDASM